MQQRFFLPFALLLLAGCLFSCKKDIDIIQYPPSAFSLDKFEQGIIDSLEGKAVGYSYSISQNGRQVRKGAGGAAVAAWDSRHGLAVPHSWNKRQDLASCSKTITALTLMRLLQDKNMNEKALLIDYLPSFWESPAWSFNDINFDMLMQHKTGMLEGELDYYSLKQRVEGGGIFLHGNYNYRNINYAFLRIAIAYLSHGAELKALEEKYLKDPSAVSESLLITAINNYYIEQVNQKVFAPCGIPYTYPKPDGETNPTMNYNFKTQDPGWNKGDMTQFAGSAGWRLSSEEQNNILAHLKYTEDILNNTWKKKMNDNLYGWSAVRNLKGGPAYSHGGYHEDKYAPNKAPDPKGRGCYTIHVLFGNNIEAAVQVNSLGGTGAMAGVVFPAYNNAWNK
ncbi:serine hydrolase [Chitinophaga japonensis]|uniref:Beta-lactamase n=1 Tax=Chitinophaga japonensis TaxID=104662 RepID=A0A562TCD1_CHIJA|nr:serine hydrolase domain-containing protein [Chitinophaga japonensis]TWI90650.1 beta-lactamase [Chitinophaga japonensis]